MLENIDLVGRIKKLLPLELDEFIQAAGLVAAGQGYRIYLVGGVVRDLLLGRTNLDVDLVVEGSAIDLARRLANITRRKIKTYPRFNTATISWGKWSVDLATARSETYQRPGALPRVKPGSLDTDLSRRDFTVNAMAVELVPARYGNLIDPYRGVGDLEKGLLRVLHEKSFTDDATRIWRGLRYEQRLDFRLEPDTLRLLRRDRGMLDTINGDRIRHELELVLKEELPEKVLGRAGELGVLSRLHPSLRGDGWLAEKFGRARSSGRLLPGLYLALLAYRLTGEESEELISRLRLPKPLAQTLRDTHRLEAGLEVLADPGLAPSRIYELLHPCSQAAVTAVLLAAESPLVELRIRDFLSRLRYVRPSLTGNDLQRLGIAPGPRMKEILLRLREARLDGKVTSKKGEEELVRGWVVDGA